MATPCQVCYETGCTAIRLCGIDAPERNDAGYEASVAGFKKIVAGKSVRCRPVEEGTICDGRAARYQRQPSDRPMLSQWHQCRYCQRNGGRRLRLRLGAVIPAGHYSEEQHRRAMTPDKVGLRAMARVTGLEPATSGVTGRRSNQLSYTRDLARGVISPVPRGCQPCAARSKADAGGGR